jgi:inositol oxygenase
MSAPVPHAAVSPAGPLAELDRWDDFVQGRYREGKSEAEFRVYDAAATPGVAEFYRLNHEGQTVAYVLEKEQQYFGLNCCKLRRRFAKTTIRAGWY